MTNRIADTAYRMKKVLGEGSFLYMTSYERIIGHRSNPRNRQIRFVSAEDQALCVLKNRAYLYKDARNREADEYRVASSFDILLPELSELNGYMQWSEEGAEIRCSGRYQWWHGECEGSLKRYRSCTAMLRAIIGSDIETFERIGS